MTGARVSKRDATRHARAKVGWAHLRENDDTSDDVKQHVNDLYARIGLGDRDL
jgi:hypothetical protein